MNVENHPVEVIGTRHDEKLYETLLSREEFAVAEELDNFYKIPPDLRDLNYDKFYDSGRKLESVEDYNSSNTLQLDVESTIELLKKIDINLSE